MEQNNKVFFIINRHSGTGYRHDIERKIISYCKRKNISCSIEFTQEPGHGTLLAKKAIDEKYKMVFAVGGDGTVNEVAKGLLHSSVPLGVIPKGSGNGLARHLKIPLRVEMALNLLDEANYISIDTFTINDRLSVNVSGIGFDGHISGLFGRDGKRGLLNYGKLVATHFSEFNEFEYDLTLDGIQSGNTAFIISFANSSQFGNNAIISPGASVCDHLLDVCLVNKMSVFQGLIFAKKLFSGTVDRSKYINIKKASQIELHSKIELPFHVDGEATGFSSHFVININPGSLLMVVPRKSHSV